MKNRLIALALALTLLFTSTPALAVDIVVKDQPLKTDQEAFIEEGRTYVPMRAIFEALGATVNYDANSGIVTGSRNGKTVTIEKPYIVSGRTMVPLRFIGESLGSQVEWHAKNRTVYVDSAVPVISNTFTEATVSKHVDGDTIWATINGQDYKIRLIGVDTPETKHPQKGVQYFGPEASNYTAKLLPIGAVIYLQKDVSDADRYGRLLRYVWYNRPNTNEPTIEEIKEHMHNARLVSGGYAQPATFPPDVKYADLFQQLSQTARSEGWGLWGAPVTAPAPAPAPKPTYNQPAPAPVNTGGCYIKGNINRKGERIYHMPGGAYYNRTNPEAYFSSEAEAQAAGFRRSKR